VRRQRPCCRRATEQRDELAPSQIGHELHASAQRIPRANWVPALGRNV
jgi:hypothetical protein